MFPPIQDRLSHLLEQHDTLFGMICRDASSTDVELMAQEGYHIIWLDYEHSAQSLAEMLRLGRTIAHLNMVPLLRVSELSRTQVQTALDAGIQIVTLPNVTGAQQVRDLVSFGKYPPLGNRGVSTTNAGAGYTLGDDTRYTLDAVNEATHLMAMIEGEEGYEHLHEILDVRDCDMITVGPLDWATSLGLYGHQAQTELAPKIERLVSMAVDRGKTVALVVLDDAQQIQRYREMGVRIFFIGEDIVLKRTMFSSALQEATLYEGYRNAKDE
ncbi:MAG: hypothetical protein HOH43_17110 [Candidatus Latescibacteria bacterium]|nr:hypothetical protein [Candidatus Latescibacterota bacterium]